MDYVAGEGVKAKNSGLGLLVCLTFAFFLTILVLLLFAFILYRFPMSNRLIGICVTGVYILSTFMGGLMLGKWTRKRKFLWGMILGITYFLLLFAISAMIRKEVLVFEGQYVLSFVLCLMGGMLGGMLA